jgi:uncharacterized protein YbgA (DUF1722 family)/uncharacterized protein YbbK (DUF523 family)
MTATTAGQPRLVVSRCIEFDHCRWNGLTISSDVVKLLRPHGTFVPVCPEVEICLGVPRPPIRIISVGGELRLHQPETGRDCTAEMQGFGEAFLDGVGEVDGLLLKGRSPSCGIKDVRVYRELTNDTASGKGTGFFAAAVQARCGHLVIEDEGRLTNYTLRHHFLTRIFASARYRAEVLAQPTMGNLVAFHAANKLLLLACHERELRLMGPLVANHERRPLVEVVADYGRHLNVALAQPPRYTASINVLMHALGYFAGLSSLEKSFFLDALDDYRAGRTPLSVPSAIVRSWIVRFNQPYLAQQTFFAPYPEDLVQVTDSGKGRDF